jgi:heme exporter protein A
MKIRSCIGVVSHFTYLYSDLSALENLRFFARMYLIPDAQSRIESLLTDVGLARRQHDLVRTFSRGMQQRLALARALLHRPNILLLDEPFTGLDINAAALLKELLQRLVREEVTVLLTSHDIDFALGYSQRILLLKNGELTIDAPAASVDKNDIVRILGEK